MVRVDKSSVLTFVVCSMRCVWVCVCLTVCHSVVVCVRVCVCAAMAFSRERCVLVRVVLPLLALLLV